MRRLEQPYREVTCETCGDVREESSQTCDTCGRWYRLRTVCSRCHFMSTVNYVRCPRCRSLNFFGFPLAYAVVATVVCAGFAIPVAVAFEFPHTSRATVFVIFAAFVTGWAWWVCIGLARANRNDQHTEDARRKRSEAQWQQREL
jgi:RNA polymerase subunit RPABC4/transcription elongation factor Spt4